MGSRAQYDVIVVGAGHAGCEAALCTARLGLSTLMVTTNTKNIAYMSCNPAIGGLAKGHMVREIDCLGGEMAVNTDRSTIQYRRLNTRKGPAVRASRSQCDKKIYSEEMKATISKTPNLFVLEAEVKGLVVEKDQCQGVQLEGGEKISARAVVITTGTFMNGVMHVGMETKVGGRFGDKASHGLSDQLKSFGFTVTRLKTGTPARIHKDSVDWSKTTPQPGDELFFPFSRKIKELRLPQVSCYLSFTSAKTHEIIRENLHRSPLYCGRIEGVGPRYCPSIEDKVVRFAEKERHQTFLEPEGLDSDLIYVQGMSTSLPADVQYEFLRSIAGLENVQIVRPGYAVEYDFIHPTQMKLTLETKAIENLYLAGQVNGTSGYEEAAAQGFWAGANAANKLRERDPFILTRQESYIGVLIDDLVTKGTEEPYRMFTSRAEFRLLLREDNTQERLLQKGFDLGLISQAELDEYNRNQLRLSGIKEKLVSHVLVPNEVTLNKLKNLGTASISKPTTLEELLRRPEVSLQEVRAFDPSFVDIDAFEKVEITVKYAGYIQKQNEMAEQAKRLESYRIPQDFSYDAVHGLSSEEVEKLGKVRPVTVGQASRISGVNPSAIQAILINMKSKGLISRSGTRLELAH